MFLTEVTEGPDGNLLNKTIKVIPQVSQTLGVPYEEFLKYGQVGRENPSAANKTAAMLQGPTPSPASSMPAASRWSLRRSTVTSMRWWLWRTST